MAVDTSFSLSIESSEISSAGIRGDAIGMFAGVPGLLSEI
jgi:hypothetical protein